MKLDNDLPKIPIPVVVVSDPEDDPDEEEHFPPIDHINNEDAVDWVVGHGPHLHIPLGIVHHHHPPAAAAQNQNHPEGAADIQNQPPGGPQIPGLPEGDAQNPELLANDEPHPVANDEPHPVANDEPHPVANDEPGLDAYDEQIPALLPNNEPNPGLDAYDEQIPELIPGDEPNPGLDAYDEQIPDLIPADEPSPGLDAGLEQIPGSPAGVGPNDNLPMGLGQIPQLPADDASSPDADANLGEHNVGDVNLSSVRLPSKRKNESGDNSGFDVGYSDDARVRVQYYVNENTLKERLQLYFIKDRKSSLRIRIVYLFLKLLACILYVVRVIMDTNPANATCFGCPTSKDFNFTDEDMPYEHLIKWNALIWVRRPFILWLIQVIIAYIGLIHAFLQVYLGYRGNLHVQLFSRIFLLEMINTLPLVITVLNSSLQNLFIPVFLNCWLAKSILQDLFNDLHRVMQRTQTSVSHRMMILSFTLVCLLFTSVCGIQHLQRAGFRNFDLFQAIYYVIVTFSTVGYGDYIPDIWISQCYMIAMICIAVIVVPIQFEQFTYAWVQHRKLCASYSSHGMRSERHVVLCSSVIQLDVLMDFLNEIEDHFVVLLVPSELDNSMKTILEIPIWAERALYIQGSCLKDVDLNRTRMNEAEACFILSGRNYTDKTARDEHTILRAWAVIDYTKNVPLFVQISKPENKILVQHADHVVCEDELKYALLANNCTIPGVSTLVTLLLHTSRGEEGQDSDEEWQRLYGQCSGNEIYHIRLGDSLIFGEYEGMNFTYASFHSHRKYGVTLVGIRPASVSDYSEEPLLLNPGPMYTMKEEDICFYLSITKEENSLFEVPYFTFPENPHVVGFQPEGRFDASGGAGRYGVDTVQSEPSITVHIHTESHDEWVPLNTAADGIHLNVPQTEGMNNLTSNCPFHHGSRRPSLFFIPENPEPTSNASDEDDEDESDENDENGDSQSEDDEPPQQYPWSSPHEYIRLVRGFPPISAYIGVTPTLCHLLRKSRPPCCLQLITPCDHSACKTAHEYKWQNEPIILAADYASYGIYNFIIPLRAYFRPKNSLHPIVLLLGTPPEPEFLEPLARFPAVYWMQGSIDRIDDLLRAGIVNAKVVVVVNREGKNDKDEEDNLVDCKTIVSVQTMLQYFPNVHSITELSQSSNMRFIYFCPNDNYALQLSKLEKEEKDRGSHISFMFRLPFASGKVFSVSMLDTLLFQALEKDYLIDFIRLLLGVDQTAGSGFLTSMTITKDDMWLQTYGRLYQKLCATTYEIPIGIYRTEYAPVLEDSPQQKRRSSRSSDRAQKIQRAEIANLVRSRMKALNLPQRHYNPEPDDKHTKISYPLINPEPDLNIREGDIIYLLAPSSLAVSEAFERHNSRRQSVIGLCSPQVVEQMVAHRMRAAFAAASESSSENPQPGPSGYGRGNGSSKNVGFAEKVKITLSKIDLGVSSSEDEEPTPV